MEGGAGDCALALVGEEDDGAVGEIERGERRARVRHVGKFEKIGRGFGQEEVLVGGEGLIVNGNSKLGLD